MKRLIGQRWLWLIMLIALLATSQQSVAVQGNAGQTDQIGEVLGTAVFRDQIQQEEGRPLSSELFRLFFHPVMNAYFMEHQQELQPTPQEIEEVTTYLTRKHQEAIAGVEAELQTQLDEIVRKLAQSNLPEDTRTELEIRRDMLASQLQPPGRQYVEWLLGSWKLQRHLYLNYGGGRILWQQSGLEAFDATYQWLTQQEQAGTFNITDDELRTAFYAYWTTLDHGAFLIEDQARIDQEFLYPEWAQEMLRK